MPHNHFTLHRPRFGLRLRFITVIILILLVLFSALAYILLRNARNNLSSDLNKNSAAFAQLATRPIGDAYTIYQSYGSVRVMQEVQKFKLLNGAVSDVTIVDITGKVLFSTSDTPSGPGENAAASFDPTYRVNNKGVDTEIVQPYFDTNGQHQLAIRYVISTANLEKTLTQQIETIISFSILGLTVTGTAIFWLTNRLFLRPIRAVSQVSTAISHGQYALSITSKRHDEIGDLASSVNQMATNLKADISKLTEVDKLKNEFIMITSHNLRTPLSIMNGNLELLQLATLPESVNKGISAIESSVKRLALFSEDVLTIASIENGELKLQNEPTTVGGLLGSLEESSMDLALKRQLTLDWQLENPETPIEVSISHIHSAVRNLVDNAIKFTNAGGVVRFNAKVVGSDLIITVADNGIGIDATEMPKLFTKFHRGTGTLTYDYEGTGIGLYATKLIVQAHKGKVTVASSLGSGSTFIMTLPGVLTKS